MPERNETTDVIPIDAKAAYSMDEDIITVEGETGEVAISVLSTDRASLYRVPDAHGKVNEVLVRPASVDEDAFLEEIVPSTANDSITRTETAAGTLVREQGGVTIQPVNSPIPEILANQVARSAGATTEVIPRVTDETVKKSQEVVAPAPIGVNVTETVYTGLRKFLPAGMNGWIDERQAQRQRDRNRTRVVLSQPGIGRVKR